MPFSAEGRIDIVNADWVGRAIAKIHTQPAKYDIYNLSAGEASQSAQEIARALVSGVGKRPPIFAKTLEGPFSSIMDQLASSRARNTATLVGSLFKVFLPYITYDTVFTNDRAVEHLGMAPTPFTEYCAGLYKFAKGNNYKYPAKPLPAPPTQAESAAKGAHP